MTQPAINVQGISKRFLLHHQDSRAFSIAITQQIKQLFSAKPTNKAKEFWALKDISFQIEKGEIVSLVGNNGSGKSTLLKIIAKVMQATSGTATVKGNMRALLEVGTGFHHELSGRENIFFNSAILGISRAETKKHFDEIVDFSGVESYIDIPIKYYSSGMKVRLGFAIATQFKPDVLILDEVLTVGDLGFRKKSLARIREITEQQGCTTLFVSHNLSAAQNLCNKAIWLQDGQMISFGDIDDVIESYQLKVMEQIEDKTLLKKKAAHTGHTLLHSQNWLETSPESGNEYIKLHWASVQNKNTPDPQQPIRLKHPIDITVAFSTTNPADRIDVTFQFVNGTDDVFMVSSTAFEENKAPKLQTDQYQACCTLPPYFLNSGIVYIDVLFHKNKTNRAIFRKNKILAFFAVPDPIEFGILHRRTKGAIRPKLEWKVEKTT